jgi:peptidoglycan/LPS O-acetylase OafA/YrhL
MAGTRLASPASAALDGLRGLAALMVVASHASGLGMHLVPGLSLEGIGKHGVYLFFAISAFLLTAQWLDATEGQRHAPRFWGHYLLRRVLRVYPLYALVLLVGWALAPKGLGVPLDGTAVWHHLSLQEGRSIYWSVPVEFTYYLVIPVLALWLASGMPLAVRLGAVVMGLAAVMWAWPSGEAASNGITLGYYLPVFTCGSLVAWGRSRLPGQPPTQAQGWLGDGLVTSLLVLSTPVVLTALGAARDTEMLHRQFLAWGLAWGAVLLALQAGWMPHWSRLLAWRGLRACGRWCFGLYLLHVPALYLARLLPLPGPFKAWAGLTLALALAAGAYRLIERPALRLARRLTTAQPTP